MSPTPPDCTNCFKRYYHNINTTQLECYYTNQGYQFISNCICGDCLLKTICRENCKEFNNMVMFSKEGVLWA